MSTIHQLLSPENILLDVDVPNKERAFEAVGRLLDGAVHQAVETGATEDANLSAIGWLKQVWRLVWGSTSERGREPSSVSRGRQPARNANAAHLLLVATLPPA